VLEVVGRQECVLTAQEITEQLRGRGRRAAIATVYRTLEALEEVGLLQRLETGGGAPARYEPAFPGGAHHHHHLVCNVCGRAHPFDDAALERALDSVAARLRHHVEGHEVILTGVCRDCR
jgi:Fur family transcriptional regulator, ferric uptake regulator